MKEIFSENLKQARGFKHWTQEKAAALIGVTRGAYAAWEEGRSFPGPCDLIKLADVFGIEDLRGFISNDKFNVKQQLAKVQKSLTTPGIIQQKYQEAGLKEKLAVNILLGLVDLEEGV